MFVCRQSRKNGKGDHLYSDLCLLVAPPLDVDLGSTFTSCDARDAFRVWSVHPFVLDKIV